MLRTIRYGLQPDTLTSTLQDDAISGCWFELQRQGGCGSGQLRLRWPFGRRTELLPGAWVAIELEGTRCYLGRVESVTADSPHGVALSLEGMSAQLNDVFVGGFGLEQDGQAPQVFSQSNLFPGDPDASVEQRETVSRAEDVVRLLLDRFIVPQTEIERVPELIEPAQRLSEVVSAKFQGEESVRSILKDLALRAGAHWGVDQWGRFYFLQPSTTQLARWQVGVDLVSLQAELTRERLFNRLLLTGGYVYAPPATSSGATQVQYRWRGNYRQLDSIEQYGERRLRIWVPWIRTAGDARSFAREFFREYALARSVYTATIGDARAVPMPWLGTVQLADQAGGELTTSPIETLRVQCDHRMQLRVRVGPIDPRELWPEPPHDERFPVAAAGEDGYGGEPIDVGDGPGGGGQSSDSGPSDSSQGEPSSLDESSGESSSAPDSHSSSAELTTSSAAVGTNSTWPPDTDDLSGTWSVSTGDDSSSAASSADTSASSADSEVVTTGPTSDWLSDEHSADSATDSFGSSHESSQGSASSGPVSSDSDPTSGTSAPTSEPLSEDSSGGSQPSESQSAGTSEVSTGSEFSSSEPSSESGSSDGNSSDDAASSGTTDGLEGCPGCDRVAAHWGVTLAGVMDGPAIGCVGLNGSYVLELAQTFPEWLWVCPLEFPGSGVSRIELQRAFDGWRLKFQLNGALAAEYTNSGLFQCQSNNVFSPVLIGPFCQSWPATITLRPVG